MHQFKVVPIIVLMKADQLCSFQVSANAETFPTTSFDNKSIDETALFQWAKLDMQAIALALSVCFENCLKTSNRIWIGLVTVSIICDIV